MSYLLLLAVAVALMPADGSKMYWDNGVHAVWVPNPVARAAIALVQRVLTSLTSPKQTPEK